MDCIRKCVPTLKKLVVGDAGIEPALATQRARRGAACSRGLCYKSRGVLRKAVYPSRLFIISGHRLVSERGAAWRVSDWDTLDLTRADAPGRGVGGDLASRQIPFAGVTRAGFRT